MNAGRFDARRVLLGTAAPLLAILVAFVLTSVILLLAGDPVGGVWGQLLKAPRPRVITNIINEAVVFYLSAIAVAIGFRMNLFNIGVEGQYRIAAFAAAIFAGQGWLPGPLNVLVSLLIAMLVGGAWAGIAGWLKVARGVSEVISTIMLNAISGGVVAYLLTKAAASVEGTNVTNTQTIPEDSWLTGFQLVPGASNRVYSMILLSALVGVAYWVLLGKTRFGFDLRAAGTSETAAVASGVDVKRMVVATMVISGMVSGLVGIPLLFGQDHAFGTTFQPGLGFAGIGIALIGRNHPVGIAIGSLLWAYLNQQSNPLQTAVGVAPELVAIIQGVIVLAVVIAYELIRRLTVRMEQAKVARQLAADHPAEALAPVPAGVVPGGRAAPDRHGPDGAGPDAPGEEPR